MCSLSVMSNLRQMLLWLLLSVILQDIDSSVFVGDEELHLATESWIPIIGGYGDDDELLVCGVTTSEATGDGSYS